MSKLPKSIDETIKLLSSGSYVADRALSTVVFLSLKMGRPLFLEGEAGVGKTEVAKVLSSARGRRLVRLQCYEGLDSASALYEWNHAAQMIAIRVAEAEGAASREKLTDEIANVGGLDLLGLDASRHKGGFRNVAGGSCLSFRPTREKYRACARSHAL